MQSLPSEFIIFDTEYTAWEGSWERGWNHKDEHKEVIQIGAVRVRGLQEVESYLAYVQPLKNPELSQYIIELTGVTQKDTDEKGHSYEESQHAFYTWCNNLPMYCFGFDGNILKGNSDLLDLPFPFNEENFFDVREVFKTTGVDTNKYMSSTIPEAYGVVPPSDGHDALNDARAILLALQAAQKIL